VVLPSAPAAPPEQQFVIGQLIWHFPTSKAEHIPPAVKLLLGNGFQALDLWTLSLSSSRLKFSSGDHESLSLSGTTLRFLVDRFMPQNMEA
jgi:hypothetical protein